MEYWIVVLTKKMSLILSITIETLQWLNLKGFVHKAASGDFSWRTTVSFSKQRRRPFTMGAVVCFMKNEFPIAQCCVWSRSTLLNGGSNVTRLQFSASSLHPGQNFPGVWKNGLSFKSNNLYKSVLKNENIVQYFSMPVPGQNSPLSLASAPGYTNH